MKTDTTKNETGGEEAELSLGEDLVRSFGGGVRERLRSSRAIVIRPGHHEGSHEEFKRRIKTPAKGHKNGYRDAGAVVLREGLPEASPPSFAR